MRLVEQQQMYYRPDKGGGGFGNGGDENYPILPEDQEYAPDYSLNERMRLARLAGIRPGEGQSDQEFVESLSKIPDRVLDNMRQRFSVGGEADFNGGEKQVGVSGESIVAARREGGFNVGVSGESIVAARREGGFNLGVLMDRLRGDIIENIVPLKTEKEVLKYLSGSYPGIITGDSEADLRYARQLMQESKQGMIALERLDTDISIQHAIQNINHAIGDGAGNILRRALAPKEARSALGELIETQTIILLGNTFIRDFNASNPEHLMALQRIIALKNEALVGAGLVQQKIDYQKKLDEIELRKKDAERVNEALGDIGDTVGELLAKPLDYVKDFILDENSGVIVSSGRAISVVAEGLVDGTGKTVKKVVMVSGDVLRSLGEASEKIKDPSVFVPIGAGAGTAYAVMFVAGVSNPLLIGAGVITALGASRYIVDGIKRGIAKLGNSGSGSQRNLGRGEEQQVSVAPRQQLRSSESVRRPNLLSRLGNWLFGEKRGQGASRGESRNVVYTPSSTVDDGDDHFQVF